MRNHSVRLASLRALVVIAAGTGGAVAAAVAVGCSLEANGSSDLFADTDGAVGVTDARAGGDAARSEGGPGSDASTLPDGGKGPEDATLPPDATDACVPSAELCNDQVDNDCNGLIDCADPACQPRFACTTPVPPGWVLTEYSPTTRPACDALFGASRDVVENPQGAPAACSCSCSLDPANANVGTCGLGVATMLLASGDSCTAPASTRTIEVSGGTGGGCGTVAPKLAASTTDTSLSVLAPGYLPGACTTSSTANVPPITNEGSGRACASTAALGGGCVGQSVCAPVISSAFATCVSHSGIATCPPGYAHQHILGAQVLDTRGCSACSCVGTGTCDNATLTLFASGGCGASGGGNDAGGGASLSINADGSCQTFPPSDATFSHFTYSATPSPTGCSTFGGTPTGAVTVSDPATVCCP